MDPATFTSHVSQDFRWVRHLLLAYHHEMHLTWQQYNTLRQMKQHHIAGLSDKVLAAVYTDLHNLKLHCISDATAQPVLSYSMFCQITRLDTRSDDTYFSCCGPSYCWSAAGSSCSGSSSCLVRLFSRSILLQLALLDELQQGVALLTANHVIIYLKLLLSLSQTLRAFKLFL